MIDVDNLLSKVEYLFVKNGRWVSPSALQVSASTYAPLVHTLVDLGLVERMKPKVDNRGLIMHFSTYHLTEKGKEFFSIILL